MHTIRAGEQCWMIKHTPGCMVSRGSTSPHKLPGVAGSLLGNQGFWEHMAEHHSLTASGQCHSSELHKPERGHSVESPVPTSNNNLELVCRVNSTLQVEHLPSQLYSRADQESRTVRDRCDWKLKQSVFHQIQAVMRPLEVDLFASRLTCQLPRFYSGDQTQKQRQQMSSCRIG